MDRYTGGSKSEDTAMGFDHLRELLTDYIATFGPSKIAVVGLLDAAEQPKCPCTPPCANPKECEFPWK